MPWKVRAIRGATTVPEDSPAAIQAAVDELLATIEAKNQGILDLNEIVNVIFSVTPDIKTRFPAATARQRPGWENVPFLDVQHMHVEGALNNCIRCWIQFNTEAPVSEVHHIYLRQAKQLRPDLLDDQEA